MVNREWQAGAARNQPPLTHSPFTIHHFAAAKYAAARVRLVTST
jgi:hypothetical protein